MELSYNHVSVVAIGNFNPAIASLDFLNKTCKLSLGDPTSHSPLEIPVHRHFQFQNLQFTVSIGRLDILEIGIEDIAQTKTLEIFDTYYKKLPYTPLRVVGININCELIVKSSDKADILQKKLSLPSTYLDFLGANEIIVTEMTSQTKTEKIWKSSNYRIENVKGFARLIKVEQRKESFGLNYNYETGNLEKNISDLNLLITGYKQFCDEFLGFTKYLED